MRYRIHEKTTGESIIHLEGGCEKWCNGVGCKKDGVQCYGPFENLKSVWNEFNRLAAAYPHHRRLFDEPHCICMSGYYFCTEKVYGKPLRDELVVHGSSCGRCNYGRGIKNGAQNTTWYGPYTDTAAAYEAARSFKFPVRDCEMCNPKQIEWAQSATLLMDIDVEDLDDGF